MICLHLAQQDKIIAAPSGIVSIISYTALGNSIIQSVYAEKLPKWTVEWC